MFFVQEFLKVELHVGFLKLLFEFGIVIKVIFEFFDETSSQFAVLRSRQCINQKYFEFFIKFAKLSGSRISASSGKLLKDDEAVKVIVKLEFVDDYGCFVILSFVKVFLCKLFVEVIVDSSH